MIIGVGYASRSHAIAEADCDVVLAGDLEQVIELRIERVLRLVVQHPCDGERSAPAHNR